ncbi:MAG: helix-turn-helix domain-containing protein [Acinetobacter sp.]
MRPRKLSREQLLRSALCFKQHGYTAASVSRLAQACGLSKAAFYYDFSSKDALLTRF